MAHLFNEPSSLFLVYSALEIGLRLNQMQVVDGSISIDLLMTDRNGLYYSRWSDSIDCHGDYPGEIEGPHKVCLTTRLGKHLAYRTLIYDSLAAPSQLQAHRTHPRMPSMYHDIYKPECVSLNPQSPQKHKNLPSPPKLPRLTHTNHQIEIPPQLKIHKRPRPLL